VLGRTGEPPGRVTLRWDVTRGGEPVLRQYADLDPGLRGLTAGKRVLACALISDPAVSMRTVAESPLAVAQRVNEHTVLVSVLADDAARAVGRLGELCAKIGI
jgi:urease accessory protein